MHTLLYSQQPHLPSSFESLRRLAKIGLSLQICGRGTCFTFPEETGRYPQGKTSPSCDTKQTACPARHPLVMAVMSPCPPGCPLGCPMFLCGWALLGIGRPSCLARCRITRK